MVIDTFVIVGAPILASVLTLIITAIIENQRWRRNQNIEWDKYKRELRMNLYIGIIERLRKLLKELIKIRNTDSVTLNKTGINEAFCSIITEAEERMPQWEFLCSPTVRERFNTIFDKIRAIDVNDAQSVDYTTIESEINELSRIMREELGIV